MTRLLVFLLDVFLIKMTSRRKVQKITLEMEGKDNFLSLLSLHFMEFSCLLVQKAFESRVLFAVVLILNIRVT